MKFSIQNRAETDTADIVLCDFIGDWLDDSFGFGITARAFIEQITALPKSVKKIRLHLSSPGGDVTSAVNIANVLRNEQLNKGRRVEVLIEGAAFSAATIISSAGNPTKIADNALVMIHLPYTLELGNANDFRRVADMLDAFCDTIVSTYRWKSSLPEDQLKQMMTDETWMDCDSAIANGFADSKIEGMSTVAASVDQRALAKFLPHVPDNYRERVDALIKPASAPQPPPVEPVIDEAEFHRSSVEKFLTANPEFSHALQPPPQSPPPVPVVNEAEFRQACLDEMSAIINVCVAAGVPELAHDFIAKHVSIDAARERLKYAGQIRSQCIAAKVPHRANGYIAAGMSVREVADDLYAISRARHQPGEIDNRLGPSAEGRNNSENKILTNVELFRMRNERARP